jgi:hypothetical protein
MTARRDRRGWTAADPAGQVDDLDGTKRRNFSAASKKIFLTKLNCGVLPAVLVPTASYNDQENLIRFPDAATP